MKRFKELAVLVFSLSLLACGSPENPDGTFSDFVQEKEALSPVIASEGEGGEILFGEFLEHASGKITTTLWDFPDREIYWCCMKCGVAVPLSCSACSKHCTGYHNENFN